MKLKHLCLLAIASTAFALALAGPPAGWNTPLSGDGRQTAYDGARRIFPGAERDKSGNLVLAGDKLLRMPGTSKRRASLPEGTQLGTPSALLVRSEGRRFHVLLWEGFRPESSEDGGFGEAVAVLAVFPEGSSEPSDVAEVKSDRETWLGKSGLVNLGAEDGFVVANTHHNSNQGYLIATLFHLRDGRLRQIATAFTLSNNAGCRGSFDENLRWRTEPDGDGPPRVIAEVELIHNPKDATDSCEGGRAPKPRSETFADSYRWDAAKSRYLREKGNSAQLEKWNRKNM